MEIWDYLTYFDMEVDKVLEIYNILMETNLVYVYNITNCGGFAKGMKVHKGQVIDFKTSESVITVEEVSLVDVTEIVTGKVLFILLKQLKDSANGSNAV